ncbi:MAG: ATP-binding protein [Candidatus Kerfeldbacteria bacterium]|nr:ATP-binding protein [Candidatus Kerfeldbacteria bacterium]
MIIRLFKPPENHSFFLFGPRGTGKTTLIKESLPKEQTYTIDLLDFDTENRFFNRPQEFSEVLAALPQSIKWIFIDEVQKIPKLLDEVHKHIETYPHLYFALTGSSARKLKRGQANLLAGRAFSYSLFPLTAAELRTEFQLDQALSFGTLPKIFSFSQEQEEEKKLFLRSYATTYVQEEVQNEGLIRNLQGFRRFLPIVGKENGNILVLQNIAQEVGMSVNTIRSYFEILEDTLLGFLLPACRRAIRKRQKTHPKFYLFDTGVKRALAQELNIPLVPGTSEYGKAFEHFFVTELVRVNAYKQTDYSFSYFATQNIEIDLVVERPGKPLLFVEIKSSEHVKNTELRSLISIVKDMPQSEGICISREPRKRKVGPVLVCPWQEAVEAIGL